jgi:glycosyltransferase involved in cell wall biosynthesis
MNLPSQGEACYLDNKKLSSVQRLMLFDLAMGGHHPVYIQHLLQYWCNEKITTKLDIVVSSHFINKYPDIVDLALNCNQKNIQFVPITIDEYHELKHHNYLAHKSFKEWELYCKYAIKLEAKHCLIMYFDHLQLPLALGAQSPCPFSGIYFRPTFHYDNFDNYVPSWRDRWRQWRQKFLLSRVLQNQQLKVLFCLDPFAVEHIDKLHSKAKILHLPDPVPIYDEKFNIEDKVEQLKVQLGIHGERRVFLLFGSLEPRKGIYQLLEAIWLLPPNICENLCLLLAGSILSPEKLLVEARIAEISQSLPVQIIVRDQFIPEQEVQLYFQVANVILAPYQRHVGMSGILLLAAAAQKPVLASDYGLMGKIVREHQLGLTVDSASPLELASKLQQLIDTPPNQVGNLINMKKFVAQNSIKRFSNLILENV